MVKFYVAPKDQRLKTGKKTQLKAVGNRGCLAAPCSSRVSSAENEVPAVKRPAAQRHQLSAQRDLHGSISPCVRIQTVNTEGPVFSLSGHCVCRDKFCPLSSPQFPLL